MISSTTRILGYILFYFAFAALPPPPPCVSRLHSKTIFLIKIHTFGVSCVLVHEEWTLLIRTFPFLVDYIVKYRQIAPKGPFTPETRSTPALSHSGKFDGSAMSGPWSGRAYVGLKYSGNWSGPLWEVVVSGISFSTGWKMVGDDLALHRSYVERGYSVVVGGTA